MENSNEKKSATLGMPHGTASNRLRKIILFHLLKKHGENVCVRCNEIIEKVDDLSIEHIKPWEGISADLFWDLDNVAFSHIRCNRPHRNFGANPAQLDRIRLDRSKKAPEGTAWCFGHRSYLSVDLFHSNVRNASGTASYCKECRSRALKNI